MRIGIRYAPGSGNGDCMGGFGVGFHLGTGLAARFARTVKSKGVVIPDIGMAYLAAWHEARGDKVIVTDVWGPPVDRLYVNSSLSTYAQDVKSAAWSPCDVVFCGSLAQECPELFDGNKTTEIEFLALFVENYLPAWHLYDVQKFRYYPSLKVHPIAYMQSSMGCKFSCEYCPYKSHYGQWTSRSLESIEAELLHLKNTYAPKGIVFRDPLFTGDVERTIELCGLLKRFNLRWVCETRMECLPERLIKKMAEAGCAAIHMGIESSNSAVLHDVKRGSFDGDKSKAVIDTIHANHINTTCFFLIGLPEDTVGTIHNTIDLACRLNPTVAEFFVATPVPGTPMFERVEVLHNDFTKYDFYTLVYKHKYLTPEMVSDLREQAYRRFYLRPKWMAAAITRYWW